MRCIYCLEEKDATHYTGREHVIPQAFGLFDSNNFALKCVCDACNKRFGDGIDTWTQAEPIRPPPPSSAYESRFGDARRDRR